MMLIYPRKKYIKNLIFDLISIGRCRGDRKWRGREKGVGVAKGPRAGIRTWDARSTSWVGPLWLAVQLMPSSHCMILARFFTRRQVLINHRQMPNIGGKSVLVHVSDNRALWIIKDAIWGHRRCISRHPQNIWHAKYLELSAIHNPAVWMSSGWKIHQWWPTANKRARYRALGSSERR